MSITNRLIELKEKRESIIKEYEQLNEGLNQGRITEEEYNYYINKRFGGLSYERALNRIEEKIRAFEKAQRKEEGPNKLATPAVTVAVLIIAALSIIMLMKGGTTGYATYLTNITNNTTTNLTGLGITATGEFSGEGGFEVTISNSTGNWTIISYNPPDYYITTDKSVYGLNETVNITVEPKPDLVTYYLYKDGEGKPVNNGFITKEVGEYKLDAIITLGDKVVKATTTFSVTNETNITEQNTTTKKEESSSYSFNRACEETCDLTLNGEYTINVKTNGTINLTLNTIKENHAPKQVAKIPDVAVYGETTIDLSPYFTDEDGDTIIYDINNIVGVDETIRGSQLTLKGSIPGEYEATIYASDLKELTEAKFKIVVIDTENSTTNETTGTTIMNETENNTATTETEDTTENETEQEDKTTTNQTTSANPCENPDINMRPDYCFGNQLEIAYEEINAPIENKKQEVVGRATRFGNLIIRGLLKENSNSQPGPDDFTIGYWSQEGFTKTYHPTGWIETETGDLHLKGRIYEEEENLTPPQYDSYVIQNNNGIILGYFNEKTGDLHLKGNIVQLGKV